MNSEKQQRAAAASFATRWKGRGYEKGDSQVFWTELLTEVYGIPNPSQFIRFEQQAQLDHTSFIDAIIPATHTLIEQKSLGKDLREPIRQSDGTRLTPFQQAQRYSAVLPYSERPRWIVTCNFAEFDVYDMENPKGEPQRILLRDLPTDYYRLQFLVSTQSEHLQKEMEVSMKAGEIVGRLYDGLIRLYNPDDPLSPRYLNILCVRLVFCLYAEDAGIFGRHEMFHDYLSQFDAMAMRSELLRLFDVLNTPIEKRSPYLRPDLAAFPYVNGGLFAEQIDIPPFNDTLRAALLLHASLEFDWSAISPTIFGGVFESTLNPETRRKGGMHYTSIENIHRVIDTLFLGDLRREYALLREEPVVRTRLRRLKAFQDRLAALTFFDPACGSGNFLTETYLSLRRLENAVIQDIYRIEPFDAFVNPIKVSIRQFYGIEINDFAVTVAQAALWISESQMMAETERIIRHDIDFLPLKSYSGIREGNALRIPWRDVCPAPDYIFGNPPFVGYSLQSKEQKADMLDTFVDADGKPFKAAGKIDYVAAWYYKAAQMMHGTNIRAALVSTNSVTQGEQVAAIWKPLKEMFGIHIDFARRTFRWDSEASLKAHVHCVIVGFSCATDDKSKENFIYDGGQQIAAKNINGYLMDAPDIFITTRQMPLCDVPEMVAGGKPAEGGNLILTEEEKDELLRKEPQAAPFIRHFLMGADFIHRRPRYCLWLVHANPTLLKQCPMVLKRIEAVRQFRLASKKDATRKKAETPMLFDEIKDCKTSYVAVPKVSSERRRYVPMDWLDAEIIAGDKLFMVPEASLYHFGVMESNVHMAWMRAVCGRLKSDYSYSNTIVYNNFPWPEPTEEQQKKITETAQGILDARARYPDSSLADLYDPTAMPYDLLEAHRRNDRAVMQAYGFAPRMIETECVARLFEMYAALTKAASSAE